MGILVSDELELSVSVESVPLRVMRLLACTPGGKLVRGAVPSVRRFSRRQRKKLSVWAPGATCRRAESTSDLPASACRTAGRRVPQPAGQTQNAHRRNLTGQYKRACRVISIAPAENSDPQGRIERRTLRDSVRPAILIRDGGRCKRCGSAGSLEDLSHRAFSKGGTSEEWKLQTLSRKQKLLAMESQRYFADTCPELTAKWDLAIIGLAPSLF